MFPDARCGAAMKFRQEPAALARSYGRAWRLLQPLQGAARRAADRRSGDGWREKKADSTSPFRRRVEIGQVLGCDMVEPAMPRTG